MKNVLLLTIWIVSCYIVDAQVFWSDDFSDPTRWETRLVTKGVTSWTIGTRDNVFTEPFVSRTAHNNFAMFNSSNSKELQLAHIFTRKPIKVDRTKKIELGFSQFYKNYNDSVYVVIVADRDTTKFKMNEKLLVDEQTAIPDLARIDISEITRNHDSIFIDFAFFSRAGYGYAWKIDDVYLREIPESDAKVNSVFAVGQVPLVQGKNQVVSAVIKNTGTTKLSNIPVTLDIQGATRFTDSRVIKSLDVDSSTTVTFATYNPASVGYNTIKVSVAHDDDTTNNSKTIVQHVSRNTYSMADTSRNYSKWEFYSFNGIMFLTKFYMSDSSHVVSVQFPVANDPSSLNKNIYVVLCDSNHTIIDSTELLTIASADLGTTRVLSFKRQRFLHNTSFYIGVAFSTPDAFYRPMLGQYLNDDLRTNSYFITNLLANKIAPYPFNLAPVFTVVLGTPSPQVGLASYRIESDRNFVAWKRPVHRGGIKQFNIYRKNDRNEFEIIGTQPWAALTEFTDPVSDPNAKDRYYAMSVTDTSGIESPLGVTHRTIRMVYDKGSEPPSVTWNRYEGKSFNTYAVYATGTDNKLVLIDNVASNGNESQTYIIPPRFQGYKKYCAVALFDDLFYSTTKSSSGPYSLSLSNLAESKLLSSRDVSGNISLLPCPAGDYVEINQLSDFDSYQVTNCIGQVIVEGVLSSRFIDLRDLPAGIYSMILRGSLSYAVKTFAKQ